jgi:hypothetical protein
LRKFILIFFDDILVYTRSWEDHLKCLATTLQILEDNTLALNFKKCSFAKTNVEYLGHVISNKGVEQDDKVVAIQ